MKKYDLENLVVITEMKRGNNIGVYVLPVEENLIDCGTPKLIWQEACFISEPWDNKITSDLKEMYLTALQFIQNDINQQSTN